MSRRPNIKTHKDGSIDYAHYVAASHEIRRNYLNGAFAALGKVAKIAIKVITSKLQKQTTTGPLRMRDQQAFSNSEFKNCQ